MATQLRYIALVQDENGLFSVADIIEPLPQYKASLLRSARRTAGATGYVLVGDASKPMDTYRKITGA